MILKSLTIIGYANVISTLVGQFGNKQSVLAAGCNIRAVQNLAWATSYERKMSSYVSELCT